MNQPKVVRPFTLVDVVTIEESKRVVAIFPNIDFCKPLEEYSIIELRKVASAIYTEEGRFSYPSDVTKLLGRILDL